MQIKENIKEFQTFLENSPCKLVAVSKTKPNEDILAAYEAGQLDFGENKVQELIRKHEELPKDIRWHMIGHLQTNKVKYVASFVTLIHGVDSLKLLKEINKQGKKNGRIIDCLLQIHIATEETKFGLYEDELMEILNSEQFAVLEHVKVVGLMGMATYTENLDQVREEFRSLKKMFDLLKSRPEKANFKPTQLSMGMSGDYGIAIEEGSTLIRVGSKIFGERIYH